MKNSRWLILPGILMAALLLAGCGNDNANPPPTATRDPCAPQNLPDEVGKINSWSREFDDATVVAQYTQQYSVQRPVAILELQRVHRAAEEQPAPTCLVELKQLQLDYMDTVIITLTIQMDPNAEPGLIQQAFVSAREKRVLYQGEYAGLLGLTFVPPPSMTAGPSSTPGTSLPPAATGTPVVPLVVNPGPTTLNMRIQPTLEANTVGILQVGQTASVLGKTPDELWYMIEVPGQPGQTAWVYAQLVQLSVAASTLPVVTPAP